MTYCDLKTVNYMLGEDNRVKQFLAFCSKLGINKFDRSTLIDWFISQLHIKEHDDFCQSVLNVAQPALLPSLAAEKQQVFTTYDFLMQVDDMAKFLATQRAKAGLFNNVNDVGYVFTDVVLKHHLIITGLTDGATHERIHIQAGQPVQFKDIRASVPRRQTRDVRSGQRWELERVATWL